MADEGVIGDPGRYVAVRVDGDVGRLLQIHVRRLALSDDVVVVRRCLGVGQRCVAHHMVLRHAGRAVREAGVLTDAGHVISVPVNHRAQVAVRGARLGEIQMLIARENHNLAKTAARTGILRVKEGWDGQIDFVRYRTELTGSRIRSVERGRDIGEHSARRRTETCDRLRWRLRAASDDSRGDERDQCRARANKCRNQIHA